MLGRMQTKSRGRITKKNGWVYKDNISDSSLTVETIAKELVLVVRIYKK